MSVHVATFVYKKNFRYTKLKTTTPTRDFASHVFCIRRKNLLYKYTYCITTIFFIFIEGCVVVSKSWNWAFDSVNFKARNCWIKKIAWISKCNIQLKVLVGNKIRLRFLSLFLKYRFADLITIFWGCLENSLFPLKLLEKVNNDHKDY